MWSGRTPDGRTSEEVAAAEARRAAAIAVLRATLPTFPALTEESGRPVVREWAYVDPTHES